MLAGAAVAATRPQPVRSVLVVIGGLAGAECVWAIVGRAFAAESFGLTGRLQGTLGNANSLAMLGAVATIAGLALATRAQVAGLALASLGAFTAFSTSSRAAAAATLVVAVVFALATDGRPLRRLAAPAALLPAIAFGTWASTFGVFDEVAGAIEPAGVELVLLAVAGVVAGPIALRLLEAGAVRVPAGRRAWSERALVGAGAGALLVLVAVIAASNERGAPAIAGIGHLFSSSSNFRTRWWENGLDAFRTPPGAAPARAPSGRWRRWPTTRRTPRSHRTTRSSRPCRARASSAASPCSSRASRSSPLWWSASGARRSARPRSPSPWPPPCCCCTGSST